MFHDNLSINAPVKHSVEDLIDVESTLDIDNVVIQNEPIVKVSPNIDDLSSFEHSSSVV